MKKVKFVVSLLSVSLLFAGLTACGGKAEEPVDFSFSAALESGYKSIKVGDESQIDIKESQASDYDPETAADHEYTYTSSDSTVLSVSETGLVRGEKSGTATVEVYESTEDVTRKLTINVYASDPKTGAVTYSSDPSAKTEILGKLEEYAMDENLTGISLFENGGYVMYNPRVQKGTNSYITGYGFGILGEGNITEDLASETKTEWKKYYHSASASDPKTINDLDASGSEVSNLASYISSSYFGTKMNATKNGYDWYGSLSTDDRPIPMVEAKDGTLSETTDPSSSAKVWKIHVRTGDDVNAPLQYRTSSTKTISGTSISSFDKRGVKLEDYVYAFKALLTQSFGLYRGGELAAAKTYNIEGAADYYNATADSTGVDETLWASKKVGVLSGTDDQGDYIIIKGKNTLTPFYAMYGYSSSLYRPLCQDFILALGGNDEVKGIGNYGNYIEASGASPVDTILSLGAYTLDYWEEDKAIVFKKNDSWFENKLSATENLYRIPGVKVCVYTGAASDSTLTIKEFLKGNLDAAGIPTVEYLKKYRNDARTTQTTGDSVFKLNINSCTQEQWEYNFGTDGVISQTAESNYWDVKPWMSNKSFLKGLNFSIDRDTFATNRGVIGSNNYFSTNYMSDPESGISYDSTSAHEEAIADYYPETHGFNLAASKIYFRQAVEEMVEAGTLELGTKSKPTKISLDIWWMYQSDIKDYGDEISGYIENAFNSSYVCGKKVKLKCNNYAVTTWSDVYYKHLMVGQFDLGFGSISGNSLDPLNFMNVLKSNNSSGFTLNWGIDTSVVSQDLVYDDKAWSYDALWAAGDTYVIANSGVVQPTFVVNDADVIRTADGGLKVTLDVTEFNTEDTDIITYLYALCIYAGSGDDYSEIYVYLDGSDDLKSGNSSWVKNADGTYDITFAPEIVNAFIDAFTATPEEGEEAGDPDFQGNLGVDLYVAGIVKSLGIAGDSYFTSLDLGDAFPTYTPAP